ncbi:sensor histidine kinase [Thalassotalea piscium]
MNSIKKKLSLYITLSISLLLLSILLITDVSVDNWISGEFDRAMVNKSGLLVTLVSEEVNHVEFQFSDEFMPEFSGVNDPEYFQFWLNDAVFERSKTLDLFDVKELPQLDVELYQSTITNITLPDGRSGRMYFTKFKPQVESKVRQENPNILSKKPERIMTLAYAISNENLNQVLWFVDIIFIFSSVSTVMAIRIIVSKVVEKGLRPLDNLNNQLKSINLNSEESEIPTTGLPSELIPIANGINHFLNENKTLYSREKRFASDIAHELKTPIAELLNLSEVAIKFPHEKHIADNFKSEVLDISQRLKSIVNGILLLQKSTHKGELKKEEININELILSIICRENTSDRDIDFRPSPQGEHVYSCKIALYTILTNLISNALFYSPASTTVSIAITTITLSDNNDNKGKTQISITNVSTHVNSDADLKHFFEPLWQKDSARTSTQRYGLGLAIVKSYCSQINATLSVIKDADEQIVFTILI